MPTANHFKLKNAPPLRPGLIRSRCRPRIVSRSSRKPHREQGNAAHSEAFIPLHDRLQVACAVLVIWRFGGRVTRDLQSYGFQVTGTE